MKSSRIRKTIGLLPDLASRKRLRLSFLESLAAVDAVILQGGGPPRGAFLTANQRPSIFAQVSLSDGLIGREARKKIGSTNLLQIIVLSGRGLKSSVCGQQSRASYGRID